ncbi:MAG: AAA family ATPase, partial [Promethearchaeia archaeon]
MKLQSLRMKNVKCFDDGEVNLASGKNVIVGRNGSGKSTVLQSILYSLYSDFEQGNLDEFIRLGKDTAEFELDFEHNGQEYTVQRIIRASGTNEAYLMNRPQENTIAEKQTTVTRELAEILDIKKEVFRDVILVSQGEIAEIIGMRDSERKDLFDKLLGLQEFDNAWRNCRRIQSHLATEIEQSKEIIAAYEKPASKLDHRKEELEAKKENLDGLQEELKSNRGELENVQGTCTELDEMKNKLETLSTKTEQRQEAIDREQEAVSSNLEKAEEYSNEISFSLPETVDSSNVGQLEAKAEQEHESIKEKLASTRQEYKGWLTKKEQLKALRDSETSLRESIEKLEENKGKKSGKILEVESDLEGISLEEWEEELGKIIDEVSGEQDDVDAKLDTANDLNSDLQHVEEKISGIEESIEDLEKNLSENNEEATKSVGEDWHELAEIDLRGISPKLRSVKSNIEETNEQLDTARQNKNKLEATIEQKKNDLSDLSDIEGSKCPKCKQIVDEKHAEELRNELQKTLDELTTKYDSAEKTETRLGEKLDNLEEEKETISEKKHKIRQARIYLSNENKIKDGLEEEQEAFGKLEKKLCILKEKLSQYDVEELETQSTELEDRLKALRKAKTISEDLPGLVSEIEENRKKLREVRDQISQLEKPSPETMTEKLEENIDKLEEEEEYWDSLGSALSAVKKHLETKSELVEQQKKDLESISDIEAEYDSDEHEEVKNKLEDLKKAVSKLGERIGILKDEQIPQAKELYDESKEAAENIEKIGEKQRKATTALKVVNKVRQFYREVQKPLRRRDTARASKHATEIFKTLIGSNEYDQIRIADNHDLLISRFGSFEPMRTLSGGEQVLAGLAVRLGFARALATSDLLILDEPTAYLDDQRKAELVETLDNVTPANQMLIVTHD